MHVNIYSSAVQDQFLTYKFKIKCWNHNWVKLCHCIFLAGNDSSKPVARDGIASHMQVKHGARPFKMQCCMTLHQTQEFVSARFQSSHLITEDQKCYTIFIIISPSFLYLFGPQMQDLGTKRQWQNAIARNLNTKTARPQPQPLNT